MITASASLSDSTVAWTSIHYNRSKPATGPATVTKQLFAESIVYLHTTYIHNTKTIFSNTQPADTMLHKGILTRLFTLNEMIAPIVLPALARSTSTLSAGYRVTGARVRRVCERVCPSSPKAELVGTPLADGLSTHIQCWRDLRTSRDVFVNLRLNPIIICKLLFFNS